MAADIGWETATWSPAFSVCTKKVPMRYMAAARTGGAVCIIDVGTVDVVDSSFVSNDALFSGGAFNFWQSPGQNVNFTLRNTRADGNSAAWYGSFAAFIFVDSKLGKLRKASRALARFCPAMPADSGFATTCVDVLTIHNSSLANGVGGSALRVDGSIGAWTAVR
jgi:hypothetical protein